jgi:hypothetical protein
MKKNHHERGTINNELVWLLSGKRILVGDINKPQQNKYKTNNSCIPYITAQSVQVVVYTITDVLPSAHKIINQILVTDFSFPSLTSPHHPPSVSTHILYDEWLVCYLKGYLLNIKFIRKVTLSLGLLSHSTPSFSGIRIVRKFYWIWVWIVETQHLMHKVGVQL